MAKGRTTTPKVLPLSFFLNETYVSNTPAPDDPANFPIDYKTTSLLLRVDGRAVVDSRLTRLDCVYVGLTHFTPPIVHPEPTGYGSNAAIWMFGLGYYNTWYVTVVTPTRHHWSDA